MIPLCLQQAMERPEFFFVQVGANDGVSDDSLRDSILKYRLGGLLIEPLPWMFRQLRRNWEGQPGLMFECVAIQQYEGSCNLWSLPPEESARDGWDLSVLATTQRELFSHPSCLSAMDAAELAPRLLSFTVPCTTLEALLRRGNITTVDLLQVDAQGGDFDVLRSLNFESVPPRWINYEWTLLGLAAEECEAYLRTLGYSVSVGFDEKHDRLATRV